MKKFDMAVAVAIVPLVLLWLIMEGCDALSGWAKTRGLALVNWAESFK